jgi:hypothetical protein
MEFDQRLSRDVDFIKDEPDHSDTPKDKGNEGPPVVPRVHDTL